MGVRTRAAYPLVYAHRSEFSSCCRYGGVPASAAPRALRASLACGRVFAVVVAWHFFAENFGGEICVCCFFVFVVVLANGWNVCLSNQAANNFIRHIFALGKMNGDADYHDQSYQSTDISASA